MKLLASLLMAAAMAVSAVSAQAAGEAQKPAAKPDLVKGEASYTAVCVACHAADGNSTIAANPKLAQQHPDGNADEDGAGEDIEDRADDQRAENADRHVTGRVLGFGAGGFFLFFMLVPEFAPAANRGMVSGSVSPAAASGLLPF